MSRGAPISGARAATILARVAVRRFTRSRTPWIAGVLALIPVLVSSILGRDHQMADWKSAYGMLILFMMVVPPLVVAASISEEIEERTYTYLWSRPFPRWAMVAGKLLAGWPMAAVTLSLAAYASFELTVGGGTEAAGDALARGIIGCVVGVLGTSLVSAGWAALAPGLAQRLTYAYLFVDLAIGAIDFSLRNLSITYHIGQLAGVERPGDDPLLHAIWCLAIGGFWLTIGLLRLRRAEYADDR